MKQKKNRTLEDLDQAFAGLKVKPLSNKELGRVSGGTLGCDTEGATCNWKCGDTAYWECPSDFGTCGTGVNDTCVTCDDPTAVYLSCWTDTPGGCL